MREKLILLTLSMLISSCATRITLEDYAIHEVSEPDFHDCVPIPVEMHIWSSTNRDPEDFERLGFDEILDDKNSSFAIEGEEIIDALRRFPVLKLVSPKNKNSEPYQYKIYFQSTLHTYSNNAQKYSEWLSNISLGIIPSWTNGRYDQVVKILDRNGNKVSEYRHEIPFRKIQHFTLLFGGERSFGEAVKHEIPKVYSDVFRSLKKDKIICK